MLNLYQYHTQPQTLAHYEEARTSVPEIAYEYARWVLNGRFPGGEPAIAQDAQWAYEYAQDVLKGRFPAGEAAIAQDAQWAYEYAQDVLKLPSDQARTWGQEYLDKHPNA